MMLLLAASTALAYFVALTNGQTDPRIPILPLNSQIGALYVIFYLDCGRQSF